MALVAYGNSDDSDYSNSDDEATDAPAVVLKTIAYTNGHTQSIINQQNESTLHEDTFNKQFFNLPTSQPNKITSISEDDDEFLKKKPIANPLEKPPPPVKLLAKKSAPVRIVIPALSTFNEYKQKEKPLVTAELPSKPGGLLNMLPKPKSLFPTNSASNQGMIKKTTVLVPDSISRPKKPSQPAATPSTSSSSLESSSSSSVASKSVPSIKVNAHSDSDESDAEDFFSLNTEHILPEVNMAEINAMVASKSAKMNAAIKKYEEEEEESAIPPQSVYQSLEEEQMAQQNSKSIDAQAMHALCGSRSKRSRTDDVRIIDLSGDQVHPNRDEWLRNQLQATTEYQPRGLVDEEPAAGTKRKHQITYLAHQAKANEQELQAMWAANRHTRRQTQNKYGF